jgi:small subunit ribosomal protein S1
VGRLRRAAGSGKPGRFGPRHEASHDPRTPIAELIKPGEKLEVKIIKIDEKGKIWLSRKALVQDPWGEARQKFARGSRHHGKVTRLEKFGAFVELEPGVEGLLHVSDLSFDRVEHPSTLLQEGQELDVLIAHFDMRSKKVSLHPAPPADRPEEPFQRIERGALIKVEVVKADAPGLIVRVQGVTGRQARGFIPAGQTGTQRGTDLRKAFKAGKVLDTKVLDVDPRTGEPKLSIRGFAEEEERRAHKEYRQKLKAEGGFGTLGDLLKQRLSAPRARSSASSAWSRPARSQLRALPRLMGGTGPPQPCRSDGKLQHGCAREAILTFSRDAQLDSLIKP